MSVGLNRTTDFFSRISNLETLGQNALGATTDATIPPAGTVPVKQGYYIIQAGTAVGQTLPAPVAGSQSAGGDDGRQLVIVAGSAQAHVLTAPVNAVNGNKRTLTFTAAIGSSAQLIAQGGVWIAYQLNGVTLT